MIDMTGAVCGSLTILGPAGKDRFGQMRWRCRCVCGSMHEAAGGHLRNGGVTSCGCQKGQLCAEANVKHGGSIRGRMAPEYRAWSNMIDRCERVSSKSYKDYGGRGIKVCNRWRDSFAAFLEDVGSRPSTKHTLERIKFDDDYYPGNVKWATRLEQARNRRNNINITYKGETRGLREWAGLLGIKYGTLYHRYKRGISVEELFAPPG